LSPCVHVLFMQSKESKRLLERVKDLQVALDDLQTAHVATQLQVASLAATKSSLESVPC
jgi:hypothetical protein